MQMSENQGENGINNVNMLQYLEPRKPKGQRGSANRGNGKTSIPAQVSPQIPDRQSWDPRNQPSGSLYFIDGGKKQNKAKQVKQMRKSAGR